MAREYPKKTEIVEEPRTDVTYTHVTGEAKLVWELNKLRMDKVLVEEEIIRLSNELDEQKRKYDVIVAKEHNLCRLHAQGKL